MWAPTANLESNEARIRLGIPIKAGDAPQGVTVAGVPVGDDAYQTEGASKLGHKVAMAIDRIADSLKGSPHHLWVTTRLSLQSRFDYYLQHIPPKHSGEGARLVDDAIERALRKCLKGCKHLDDPLIMRRMRLPIRYGGGGCVLRSTCGMLLLLAR